MELYLCIKPLWSFKSIVICSFWWMGCCFFNFFSMPFTMVNPNVLLFMSWITNFGYQIILLCETICLVLPEFLFLFKCILVIFFSRWWHCPIHVNCSFYLTTPVGHFLIFFNSSAFFLMLKLDISLIRLQEGARFTRSLVVIKTELLLRHLSWYLSWPLSLYSMYCSHIFHVI